MSDNHNLFPRSRITRWYDTTVDELYVYFGLVLAMGIVVKSRLEEYWSATLTYSILRVLAHTCPLTDS
ncbi:hypothetical protein HW555_002091 [Spodoptera exigua]|uniref:PiggyBac transposable element-derived protein domain-containing protein n=1 Tax=Spodoptera exigua TaxID=7107 RepID=A0A835L869_SPOEX|nr:hypothetical protein HW555_002091 [Spodoptera exigua]